MSSYGLRRPEDVTLLDGITHPRHIQGKSSTDTHDKAVVTELQAGEMGNLALAICDAVHAPKGCERTSHGRFPS